ncbi:MAG: TonB-dependent receptor plug domain-containing protein, partial [Gallionellaceae bacterium]|nr:TonB-dependent receptor plug domain-containing protein [Gallionellaceae bacterium]
MKKYTLVIACLGLFEALSAHADSDERLAHFLSMSLDELVTQKVTISTNTKQMLAMAPAVVTVITAEDIKATGATNLADMLEGVPGIHIRTSLFGDRPLVHIRGANASQTLLMVNGAPLKDLMWGYGIFWKGLPASMIERVEIIRGPGSALFGSDASAGVINVITRTAGRIVGTAAGVRAGSFGSKTGWVRHGGNWNGFDIGLTAELSDTDGYNPYIASDGQHEQGDAHYGWRNEDLRFAMARGDWRLQADYMSHGDLETGLTGAGVLDPVTRASDHRYNIDLLYNSDRFGKDWGLNAELRFAHLDYSSGDGFQERPPGYSDGTYTYAHGVINRMRSAERKLTGEVSGLY